VALQIYRISVRRHRRLFAELQCSAADENGLCGLLLMLYSCGNNVNMCVLVMDHDSTQNQSVFYICHVLYINTATLN